MMARILVIDDDPAVRRTLARGCARAGHDVVEAADGKAAKSELDTELPDLVITDIYMPNMDGIEIINLLRKRKTGTKVLAISGGGLARSGNEVLTDAVLLGAHRILHKPFTLDELNSALDALLSDA